MDATQMIDDSILESEEEEIEEEDENKRGEPLAKLRVLKNEHIPEAELPLYMGDNVLGRDPNTCTLPLPAPSVSKRHTTICISVYRGSGRRDEVVMEALVWDLGSMNGTRKGLFKLTPHVRYALSEGDRLVVADIPCQYVSCAVDKMSGQGAMRTPGNRDSGERARWSDALREKGRDTSADSEKCVNGGTKAPSMVSSPDQEETRKTPARTTCLSFEQTPTQPQQTLVPESDSDSDGEKGGGRDRRGKAVVSDSDSHISSPTCSTFLSPTNKIIPESEDESPITPCSSTKNRPKQVIVDDSEEEEGREEERAAPGGREPEESGQDAPMKQENNVSLSGGDGLPVSTPAVSTDAMPVFNMDSDTDVEGEEEGAVAASPVTLDTMPQADHPTKPVQFHMDSDTDVDEDDDALDKVPKSVPASNNNTNPPDSIPVVQTTGITLDSDTDVDDDADATVSDAATKPTSLQSVRTADSAPSTQQKDFHLDSDTDEEEENDSRTKNMCFKIDKTPSRLDLKPSGVESTSAAAAHNLHLDSDTDDEVIPAPASSKLPVVVTDTEPPTTADTGADLDILSNGDTDLEEDAPLLPPVVTATNAVPSSAKALSVSLSTAAVTMSTALQSDSDADTDVDESSVPPAGQVADPADFRLDIDTDVEDKEAGPGQAGEGQILGLSREKPSGLPTGSVPPLQKYSTPLELSEGAVEEMETQAFISPSSGPFRRALAPAMRPVVLSSCSDSQEDEDFVVAETQSFVLETRDRQGSLPDDPTLDATQAFDLGPSSGDEKDGQSSRGGSFQLGLSDSSHLLPQAQALAMESTQAFVSLDGDVNLEDTQAYGTISPLDRTSVEKDSDLEAPQTYGGDEEPARCSTVFEKESCVDFALEATQAYIPEPHSDPEDETEGEERTNIATAETQSLDLPTTFTLAMAETQPMSAFEEKENPMKDKPPSSVRRGKPRKQNEREEGEEDGEATQPQEVAIGEYLSTAETQPMATCEDEESDDEDLISAPRKRKAKALQLEEEETQPITSSELSAVETQPMHDGDNDNEEDEKVSKPPSPTSSRSLQVLTSTHISNTEIQPIATCEMDEEEEHEEEETKAGLRKTKKQPQRGKGRESEAGTSSFGSRSKRGSRVRLGQEEEQEDYPEPPKRQTRGMGKALATTRGKRGKIRPEEEEESGEKEEIEQAKRGRGRKTMKHQKDDCGEKERLERKQKHEEERLEMERKEQAEKDRLLKEQVRLGRAFKEQEEKDRIEGELRQQGRERLEKERREMQERERMDIEKREQEERERLEKERRVEQEKLERERKEKELQERLQRENAEREEKERLEREEKDRIERERKEKEERDRLEREKAEREEKERLEREEKDRIERERKEKEERDRLEREKAEREEKERLEREEKDRIERERKEQEENKRLEKAQREVEEQERLERERKEQEHQARLEREKKEREERKRVEREKQEKEQLEKEAKEKRIKEQQENKVSTRGRRAARRTIAAPSTTEPEPDSSISTNDDIPARRTRSHSNSSNSVSSERSASSVTTQESRGRGRGRGRGAKTSQPTFANITRDSNRRRTVAGEPSAQRDAIEQDINDIPPPGIISMSNSTNSLNSQNRGKGGRGRGRKTGPETDSIPPINSQSDQNSAPKVTARGRKSRKVEGPSNEVSQVDGKEKADSQQPTTTRGRRRANANGSESTAADGEDQSTKEEESATEDSLLPKRNVRGRGQKAIKCETFATPVAAAVNDGDEAKEKDKGKGRKRELEEEAEEDDSSGSSISRGKVKAQRGRRTDAAEEEQKEEMKEENPVPIPAKRRGRASTSQGSKNAQESLPEVEVKEESKKVEEEIVERKARGRQSVAHKKEEEREKGGGTSALNSMDQDTSAKASEVPQTPTSSASRKRAAPVDSSPVAKTRRSSSASPATVGRFRAASQAYKVLFTGLVDEAGERVLARLGGSLAKGVADMTCLVTDKVRRTVKFLCAVAKGVPIVTTHWLQKSGKAGSFLSPNAFIVKDAEQENKFNFCLQESLRIASSQPLLQGYEIHVTKSVKPEPVHMKDIISCSGASFLPKMPSSHKAQTIVIACEEDWSLCGPALSASLPVLTAEFILTGILQQKLDFNTHALPAPTTNPQSAGGRGRGRKKT